MHPLDVLDDYLNSERRPDACMGLSDLDGFLTGVACFPEEIPEDEWLDVALGDARGVPSLVVEAVRQRHNDIRTRLDLRLEAIEPVFWKSPDGQVIAMDWCEGFMEAVKLRPRRWRAFNLSDRGAELMLPILAHMFDEEGESLMGIAPGDIDDTLDQAAEAIPTVVPAIYRQITIFTRN